MELWPRIQKISELSACRKVNSNQTGACGGCPRCLPDSKIREIAFYEADGMAYHALRGGQALVVNGATVNVVE